MSQYIIDPPTYMSDDEKKVPYAGLGPQEQVERLRVDILDSAQRNIGRDCLDEYEQFIEVCFFFSLRGILRP